MQLSERLKATLADLARRAKQLVTPFAVDEFVRQILVKDVALLRERYRGSVPRSMSATDLAAYLELHDGSTKLISDHCVTEGLHILRGSDFFQVVKTVHGRRHNIAVLQHLHAALIVYCEHLLADLRSQPVQILTKSDTILANQESNLSRSATNKLRLVTGMVRKGSTSVESRPTKRSGPTHHKSRHLHLVH